MPERVKTTAQTDESDGGNAAVERAQDKAKEVASEAQEKARDAAGQARGRVREQIDRRSTQLGERVSSNGGEARSVADELRNQGKDTPAHYVEQVADRAERLAGYLRDSDADRILGDVEGFARRNTWAVAVGGLGLGFVASRLLKVSSGERYRSSLERSHTGDLTTGSTGPRFTRESDPTSAGAASTGPAGDGSPATAAASGATTGDLSEDRDSESSQSKPRSRQ